jgi:hypothetical protein
VLVEILLGIRIREFAETFLGLLSLGGLVVIFGLESIIA